MCCRHSYTRVGYQIQCIGFVTTGRVVVVALSLLSLYCVRDIDRLGELRLFDESQTGVP